VAKKQNQPFQLPFNAMRTSTNQFTEDLGPGRGADFDLALLRDRSPAREENLIGLMPLNRETLTQP
jgi:hypothetical protein